MKPHRNKLAGKNTVPKSRPVQTEPVQVYCRIRPLSDNSEVVCLRAQNERTLQLLPPEIFSKFKDCVVSEYTFRQVFSEKSAQEEVFQRVALPLVDDLINGKNGLLFTYGVTSSGKTYTMVGNPENGGILPRSLDVIFNSIQFQKSKKFIFKPNKQHDFYIQSPVNAIFEQQKEICQLSQKTPGRKRNIVEWSNRSVDTNIVKINQADNVYAVFVSFVEIYNNYIYDLLDDNFDTSKGKLPQSKALREDQFRNMYVSEANEVEVTTAEEAFEVFWKGQRRRKVAHTVLNAESSRSHSVFIIRLVQAVWDSRNDDVDSTIPPVISQLSLVDLAGSERTGRTRNAGTRLKEAGNINNSLMVLRQCIEVLREKQTNPKGTANKMVPYRDNKLTLLFKSFFEGEGQVRMIVCANPGIDEFEETVQAMKFAELTQEVLIPRQVQQQQQRPPVPPKVIRMTKTDTSTVLTLGPGMPDVVLNCPEDSQPTKTLEDYLLARVTFKAEALDALAQKQASFREQMVQFQTEYNTMRQQVRTLQMDLAHRVDQLANLERKWGGAEQTMDSLQRKVSELERSKRSLQAQLRDKEQCLNDNKVDRMRLEVDMKDRLEMERERMRRMMVHRLAAKEAELRGKMCLSEEKLRMLREILDSGDDWVLGETPQRAAVTSDPRLNREGFRSATRATPSRDAMSRSDPKLTASKTSGRSGIPAANPRHRRSISAGGDKWIEHIPPGSVETGTVFQPKLKKKKSVSKLESKDVLSASKYILTHQDHKEGTDEVHTQLYKGNVIPSAGGGAQVIFDDVEALKQTSPSHGYTLRKRSAEQAQGSENHPASKQDILLKRSRV